MILSPYAREQWRQRFRDLDPENTFRGARKMGHKNLQVLHWHKAELITALGNEVYFRMHQRTRTVFVVEQGKDERVLSVFRLPKREVMNACLLDPEKHAVIMGPQACPSRRSSRRASSPASNPPLDTRPGSVGLTC